MALERRTFLVGALSAVSLATLSACTPPAPRPTATITPTELPPSPVPHPASFLRTSWANDPYALGSFSMTPVGATPADRATLRDTVGARVFFAGEATSSEFPGTLAGADASGVAVAARVEAVAQPDERIAVIGAGLAGARAARLLADAGFDIVVVEARDRVGGRIDTRDDDSWPFPVELGAASVTGSDLDEPLRTNDVGTISLEATSEVRTADGVVVPPSNVGPNSVTTAVEWARAQTTDSSLASALSASGAANVSTTPDAAGVSSAAELAHYLDTVIASEYGANSFRLSASWGLDRSGLADGERLVVGGLETVVSNALDDLDVLLSSTVIRIGYDDDGVSLRLGTGESLSVDRVIVTVPIGVLQAGTIEFAPPLPEAMTTSIESLGMGSLEQLWLRFDEPFWSTDATVLSVIDETSEIAEWINLLPATGQPILVGLTAADDVPVVLKQGDDELIAAALRSLVPFVDASLSTTTASPTPSLPPTPTLIP
ncbi:flavin monoamine oxidase family protein [Herbiconiux daphne]|uniref:FAD-dependent oxidoreductase n=1 Tax=Herbiconiux daphne TaxID=2970914 RepID=A0ABT2H0T2_9MICO|nr:FAD-dependent oxidoreductase [Herbiconiux daphne]MCS5733544.1 FAD-dependent oxidoreductase [Herbiconiux daphne]